LFETLGVLDGIKGGTGDESTAGGTIKRISRFADSNIVTTSGMASFRLFRMAPLEGIIILEDGACTHK
jgi:hypothetical protein